MGSTVPKLFKRHFNSKKSGERRMDNAKGETKKVKKPGKAVSSQRPGIRRGQRMLLSESREDAELGITELKNSLGS